MSTTTNDRSPIPRVGRRKRWLLAACLCVAGAVAWFVWPGGPEYHGRSLGEWIRRYPDHKQRNWREAEAALRHFGTNAIPTIFREMIRPPPRRLNWHMRLWMSAPSIVRQLIGPPSSPSNFGPAYAPEVFGAIGPQSIPHLIAALDDRNKVIRMAAVNSLAWFGPHARDALPKLSALDTRELSGGAVSNAIAKISRREFLPPDFPR